MLNEMDQLGPGRGIRRSERLQEGKLIASAIVAYVLCYVFLTVGLKFDMMRSDVMGYWNESFRLTTPYSTWWVPGYPYAIALIRTVTLGMLQPLLVMVLISLASYVVAALAVYRLAQVYNAKSPMWWALVFSAFPFVGLTYSVYPVADSLAIALFLLTLLMYRRRHWFAFGLTLALAMLTQKAIWFFVLPLMVVVVLRHREGRVPVLCSTMPLLVLFLAGAFYHRDLFWLVRWSTETLLVSRSALPVFDGIFGSIFLGGTAQILKGVIALALFVLAIFLMVWNFRQGHWVEGSVALGIVLMGIIINHYEIWAMVRFSKVLIVSLVCYAAGQSMSQSSERWSSALWFRLFVTMGLMSNLMYGYYMAKFYFSQ